MCVSVDMELRSSSVKASLEMKESIFTRWREWILSLIPGFQFGKSFQMLTNFKTKSITYENNTKI